MLKSKSLTIQKKVLLLVLAALYLFAPLHHEILEGFHKTTHLLSRTSAAHEHENGHLEALNHRDSKYPPEAIAEKKHSHEHQDHHPISSEEKNILKVHSKGIQHQNHKNLIAEEIPSEEKNSHVHERKGEQEKIEKHHKHAIVSFLSKLFATEKNTDDHQNVTELKLDKHFSSEWYISENLPKKYRKHTFYYNVSHHSTFLQVGIQPPKSYFSYL